MTAKNFTPIDEVNPVEAAGDAINDIAEQLDDAIGDLTTLGTTPKTSVAGAVGTATPSTTAKTISGAINELDTDIGNPATLGTTPKTSVVAAIGTATPATAAKTISGAINELAGEIGDMTALETSNKTDLVGALDELQQQLMSICSQLGIIYNPYLYVDLFSLSDGYPQGGWLNSLSWRISGKSLVFAPSTTERAINGGAEGAYVSGLAPDWTVITGDGSKAEEDTIVHTPAGKAEKVYGSGREYLVAETSGITVGKAYHASGWIDKISGTLKFVARGEPTSSIPVTAAGSGYKKYGVNLVSDASLYPIVRPGIDANPSGVGYADDFSVLEYEAASRMLLRRIGEGDWIIGAILCFAGDYESNNCNGSNHGMGPGLVMMVDDPANPQNYISVNYDGIYWYFKKTLAGVTAALVTSGARPTPAYNRIEIHKVGNDYSFYLNGVIVGTPQTVTDAGIIANRYVGVQSAVGFSLTHFLKFWSQPINVDEWDYEPVAVRTQAAGYYNTSTYPTGKAVISLRFDDGYDLDYAAAYQKLASRGLVGTFAVIAGNINKESSLTVAQLLEMQAAGMEIACHSMLHDDPGVPPTPAKLRYEIGSAGEYMRRIGLNIDAWVQPGIWWVDVGQTDPDFYGSSVDYAIREFFATWEGYHQPIIHTLPMTGEYRYAVQHTTCDQMTQAQIIAVIDARIADHCGEILTFHTGHFDLGGGYITTAIFEYVLNYIQARKTAGDLVVLTDTQQTFATPV